MDNLFKTGIRPVIDAHLAKLAEERRDYGDYWSASSAGYCNRRLIMERLNIPPTSGDDPRKQRVFSAGDVFHEWLQRITKDAGLSIGQELELQDEDLMVRGHIDDLIVLNDKLILYDYKSTHSKGFTASRLREVSHYHRMQVGTYMYMLRQKEVWAGVVGDKRLSEARILKISKDDLRMAEHQVLYTPALEKEVVGYWRTLNGYWRKQVVPDCTCDKYENGFLAREAFNPFWYQGQPCSLKWFKLKLKEAKESQ
jgi:hypothetical protein